MAKSVRLDPDLQFDLERAAKALNISQSQLIRDAVARRCREILGETLDERVAPVIGAVQSEGGRARGTGSAFRAVLTSRRSRGAT